MLAHQRVGAAALQLGSPPPLLRGAVLCKPRIRRSRSVARPATLQDVIRGLNEQAENSQEKVPEQLERTAIQQQVKAFVDSDGEMVRTLTAFSV